eukprot:SAG31_NODE_3642_length_4032_cov_1.536232_1_plen_294_part_00
MAPLVSEAMLAKYEEDGFLLWPAVLSKQQCCDALAAVEFCYSETAAGAIHTARRSGAGVDSAPRWMRQRTYEHRHRHPIFVDLLAHPLVIEFARKVLGPDFHTIAAQCSRINAGPDFGPQTGHAVRHIHQDTPFFVPGEGEARKAGNMHELQAIEQKIGIPLTQLSFSAMWYLRMTPLSMGPTQLLKGSHRQFKQFTNEEAAGSPRLVELAESARPVAAGSLLIFNHKTWHRTDPQGNRAEEPRDIVTNAYALPLLPKAQLLQPSDGGPVYMPPKWLPAESSMLWQLLRPRPL